MCRPDCAGCPFNYGHEESEVIQNYGCLPTPGEIVAMRVHAGRTWACHSSPELPCAGAIQYLAEQGLPYAVVDPQLVTEDEDWSLLLPAQEAQRGTV